MPVLPDKKRTPFTKYEKKGAEGPTLFLFFMGLNFEWLSKFLIKGFLLRHVYADHSLCAESRRFDSWPSHDKDHVRIN